MTMQKKIQKINKYLYLSKSKIHSNGVFALKDIPAGTKIIQYKGKLISKKEGTKRQAEFEEQSKKDPSKGAVYIFEIDEENDLDGTSESNYAKNINHSCNPNCKYEIKNKEVWIHSLREIKKGEEICFNYGFDWDENDYMDFPCKCGTPNCVGYIVEEKSKGKLIEHLKKKKLVEKLKNTYCRLKPSPVHGVGIFAIRDIPKGVNPFPDETQQKWVKINKKELKELDEEVMKMVDDFWWFDKKGHGWILEDGLYGMPMSTYNNHSKTPNIKRINENGDFITLREIKKGEEIFVDHESYD